jgi:uncharacterized protein YndB with AHSA1/START domain
MMKKESAPESTRSKKLEYKAFYPQPANEVWEALTDRTQLENWFMSGDFEARVGYRFRWEELRKGRAQVRALDCEIQIVAAPELLSYKVTDPETGSVSIVSWTVEAKPHGTEVRIEQEFLTEADLKPHPQVVSMALHRARRIELPKLLARLLAAYLLDSSGHGLRVAA